MLFHKRVNLSDKFQRAPTCKKKKSEIELKMKKYSVKAVQAAISYTVRSSMTAGNAGLDVALCTYLCL